MRCWKFWKPYAEVDPTATDEALRDSRHSLNRAHLLSAQAQQEASRSAQLRESNGFAEAVYDLMFGQEKP